MSILLKTRAKIPGSVPVLLDRWTVELTWWLKSVVFYNTVIVICGGSVVQYV